MEDLILIQSILIYCHEVSLMRCALTHKRRFANKIIVLITLIYFPVNVIQKLLYSNDTRQLETCQNQFAIRYRNGIFNK